MREKVDAWVRARVRVCARARAYMFACLRACVGVFGGYAVAID